LAKQDRGAGNEIQLTDGILRLGQKQKLYGYHYRGETYDCGTPEGFVEANVAFALGREDIGEATRTLLRRFVS
jgi:UTP--glucose-1-phosphate uridylyltransferase